MVAIEVNERGRKALEGREISQSGKYHKKALNEAYA
jgi:hypothetical protein